MVATVQRQLGFARPGQGPWWVTYKVKKSKYNLEGLSLK